MNVKSAWLPGENSTLRGVDGKIFWAYPTIVVQDSADLIALYLPAGAVGKDKIKKPTPQQYLDSYKFTLVDNTWKTTDILMLIVPNDAFSTYLMWEAGTKNFVCWYVNLQEPIRRTSIGFDTMDNMLDVIISLDMSEWKWKDDIEFTEAERIGLYSHQKASEVWAEGEKAVRLITSERRPFYEHWKEWRANPKWEIPKLSPHWDKVNLDEQSS